MYYFKFEIPTNADGTTVSYSPGWCGTRPYCAEGEKGLYYNDKERWGLAIAQGNFVPPDVEVIKSDKVAELMGSKDIVAKEAVLTMDTEGVVKADGHEITLPEITDKDIWYGKKLVDRYKASEVEDVR